MPYIRQEEREGLDVILDKFDPAAWTAGMLAYVTYRLLKKFISLETTGGFFRASVGCGAVLLTVMHFVVRDLTPYEAKKEQENGGVE